MASISRVFALFVAVLAGPGCERAAPQAGNAVHAPRLSEEQVRAEWAIFEAGDPRMRLGQALPVCVRGTSVGAHIEYFSGEDAMSGRYRIDVANAPVDVVFTYDRWFPTDAISDRSLDLEDTRPGRSVTRARFQFEGVAADQAKTEGYIVENLDMSAAGGRWARPGDVQGRPLKAYFRYRPGDEASRRVARAFAHTAQGCLPDL